MYRQILVHSDHTPFQTIYWREGPDQPLKTYELLTLTYGTKPASYIAVKCVQQLAKEEGKEFPLAAKVLMEDLYMDDLLTGAETVEELASLKEQLEALLSLGGFALHKWNSNVGNLGEKKAFDLGSIFKSEQERETKLLGIGWSPITDTLHFMAAKQQKKGRVTKRAILSEIAGLFDPLGIIGPVITSAKILMQELWICKVGWDDSVPLNVQNSWLAFRSQLSDLHSTKIPRLIGAMDVHKTSLHGFSDASEKAYGACIYIYGVREFQIETLVPS
ncbi:PREDICTED: uncharacterized protein LOC105555747 [Vollenhovia emeryi]|uniref:uncharacterized protein LOC105555747 n=1 Tax=Vollenhovia emeryi TaxID=411798 RepID=UPI0005F36D4D|nr:PREDICTED: uncharacterized protein LOC105555747 [Vollenhovia emeryi]